MGGVGLLLWKMGSNARVERHCYIEMLLRWRERVVGSEEDCVDYASVVLVVWERKECCRRCCQSRSEPESAWCTCLHDIPCAFMRITSTWLLTYDKHGLAIAILSHLDLIQPAGRISLHRHHLHRLPDMDAPHAPDTYLPTHQSEWAAVLG